MGNVYLGTNEVGGLNLNNFIQFFFFVLFCLFFVFWRIPLQFDLPNNNNVKLFIRWWCCHFVPLNTYLIVKWAPISIKRLQIFLPRKFTIITRDKSRKNTLSICCCLLHDCDCLIVLFVFCLFVVCWGKVKYGWVWKLKRRVLFIETVGWIGQSIIYWYVIGCAFLSNYEMGQ